MPVTIRTCNFKPETWSPPYPGKLTSEPLEILRAADPNEVEKCEGVFQCSTSKIKLPESVVASPNGLIYAVIEAWNRHYNLILRPDDFWFAIVSQLCFYITANAEALRSHFVAHEGKKELHVEQVGTIDTVDYDLFANVMAESIGKNVKDSKLKDWVLPDFTTTTPEDRTVAAVLFMGAMQKYFEYFFDCTMCAIPEITLLGEREDWVKLQNRLDKLLLWGEEAREYHRYLVPIFKNIVASFDDPTSKAVVSFWGTMVSHHGPDSGSGAKPDPYITGWMTGLFLWNSDGKVRDEARASEWSLKNDAVTLDKVYYPRLYLGSELIPAVASVPVTVRELDNAGNVINSVDTHMTAGVCGFKSCEERGVHTDPAPNIQSNALKHSLKGMGPKLWRRLSNSLKSGHTNETGGDPEEKGPSERTGDVDGGSKDGAPNGKKSSFLDSPSHVTAPGPSKLQRFGPGPNTVKPVAFWWIYKVKENKDAKA